MAKMPIIGGFNVLLNEQSANERSINLMQETYNGRTDARLRPTPGGTVFATLPELPIRGSAECANRAFVAAGRHIYEVFTDGTYAVRGLIQNNGNPVRIDTNGIQIIVVDGQHGWGMTLSDNVFTQIMSPNFYPTRTINVVGGYAIGVREDTQQFFYSDQYDVFTWIFSDFASAEVSPDNLLVTVSDSIGVIMLGDKSLEVAVQTTDPVQVFQRRLGYSNAFGCAATYSAINIKNAVMWLGKDKDGSGTVLRMAGGVISQISTVAVSEALKQAGDQIMNATAFGYQLAGKSFYCLNIPNYDSTLCYDIDEKIWHERRSFKDDTYSEWLRYRPDNHMYVFGKNIVGSYDSGELFALSNEVKYEGALLIKRVRQCTPIYDDEGSEYGVFSVFGVDCTVGMGDTNPPFDDPIISMATSDDNGISFGYERFKSLGKRGKRLTQIRWKRCGYSRSRVFRLTTMAPVEFDIRRAWVE